MFVDPELRRTLWSLVAFPKLKRQLLLMDPVGLAPKDFTENTSFWINQDFAIIKNGRIQRRGKVNNRSLFLSRTPEHAHYIYIFIALVQINLIGRLQLSTERSQQEDNQSIVQLRILRTQEAIIKIMKMRKKLNNAALQVKFIVALSVTNTQQSP